MRKSKNIIREPGGALAIFRGAFYRYLSYGMKGARRKYLVCAIVSAQSTRGSQFVKPPILSRYYVRKNLKTLMFGKMTKAGRQVEIERIRDALIVSPEHHK